MKKIIIIGSSKLPIPATKGGAVPNLIEQLLRQNEIERKYQITCLSLFDEEAQKRATVFRFTNFIWAQKPALITYLDRCLYWFLSNVFHVERLHSLSFLFQVIWLSFFVGRTIKKQDYDVVIFENSIPLLFSMKLYGNKRRYKGKYYVHLHSVPRKYYGNGKIVENAAKVICISQYVADAIIKSAKLKIDQQKIALMYNCIDTDKFKEIEEANKIIREKLEIDINTRIILFTGRLCKDKGIEEVIEAVKQIKNNKVILLVVGSNFYKTDIKSPYEEKLVELAKTIKDRILFTGYVDYEKMPLIYNCADVVVLPSMWEEPAGMTIIEAMACKRPVITTYSGGIPEYVDDKCVLVRRDEKIVQHLVEKINKLLYDFEYKTLMVERSYLQASKYNLEYYYYQLKQIVGE